MCIETRVACAFAFSNVVTHFEVLRINPVGKFLCHVNLIHHPPSPPKFFIYLFIYLAIKVQYIIKHTYKIWQNTRKHKNYFLCGPLIEEILRLGWLV